jgi:hypothetical protein
MRRQAGLAAYSPRAALIIQHMLADGELPPPRCAGCDAAEANLVNATAICERAPARGSRFDEYGMLGMLAAWFFGWWVLLPLLLFPRRGDNEGSEDRTVRVPLRLCPQCRDLLRPSAALPYLYFLMVPVFAGGLILLVLLPPVGCVLLAVGFFLLAAVLTLRQRKPAQVRRLWRTVPVYRQLLEQYPDAKLIVDV